MHEKNWEAIERELRREVRPDPEAVHRVMARVRAGARAPGYLRLWRWLLRPRPVAVSPLAGVLATTVMAFLVAAPLYYRGGAADRLADPARLAAGDTTGDTRTGDSVQHVQHVRHVQFVLIAAAASHVALVGDFNNWDPQATPLRRTGADGVWSTVLPLRDGRYLYAFVVDGTEWMADEAAPHGPEAAFGPNSVILVGESL